MDLKEIKAVLKVRSMMAPVFMFFSLVRMKAPPLPGLTH